MAKAKSRQERRHSNETRTVIISDAERQSQGHDPALSSLFAQSVSQVQMQSTCS